MLLSERLLRMGGFAAARARPLYRARGAELGHGVRFGANVTCDIHPGGRLVIGDDVEIGAGTTLAVAEGAELLVGARVFISGSCTIGARRHVSIGPDSMLGEMVCIRDHDHDPAYPPRSGRTLDSEIHIGERVWIAAKASVVRGGGIGDDVVIGAHALVNRPVPARSLAVGIPARVIKFEIKAHPT